MKATLRRNGSMMFTVNVQFAIGIDDISLIVLRRFLENGDIPQRKTDVLRELRDRLKMYGPVQCGDWDGFTQAEIDKAYEIARKIFHELCTE